MRSGARRAMPAEARSHKLEPLEIVGDLALSPPMARMRAPEACGSGNVFLPACVTGAACRIQGGMERHLIPPE
jgi:hypothetical protein